MFTETATLPLFVPEAGNTLSQFPPELVLAVAVQFSVPTPELETPTAWLEGLLPPRVALKESEDGEINIAGKVGAPERVRVTLTLCGVLLAPEAAIWMLPL